ncbi:MAG: rhomboid family intramembrane serine protease [Saezia sp.]
MKALKTRVALLVSIVAVILGCHVINLLTGGTLNANFGLLPRHFSGLWGIFCAPWLHGDWSHLWSNLPVLLLLSVLIMWESVETYFKVSIFIILLGGLLVWLFGRTAYHIGASGWIFGLWAWLITRSYFEHNLKNFVLSAFVIFLYGGVIWGFLPQTGVSVEGHIAGALSGIIAAASIKPKSALNKKR